ncbi:ULS1 ATP-dependent helicase ULS1 [Candida maltosa Xu316]
MSQSPNNESATLIQQVANTNTNNQENIDMTSYQTTPEEVILLSKNNETQEPPVKKPRLESILGKPIRRSFLKQDPVNASNSIPFQQTSNVNPKVEIITLSDDDDDDEISSSKNNNHDDDDDDDDLEILDNNAASGIHWKHSSFEDDGGAIGQSIPVKNETRSNDQPTISILDPNIQLPSQFMSHPETHSNSKLPGTFPESNPPNRNNNNNDDDDDDDDDFQIIDSRVLPSSTDQVQPPLFNVPAPVPHVTTSAEADEIKRQELKNQEEKCKKDLDLWVREKTRAVNEVAVAKAYYDRALQIAIATGNHSEADKIRQNIKSQMELLKNPKSKINKGQQVVMKIEEAIRLAQSKLVSIVAKIRSFGHAANATMNPYEAQIFNESHGRSSLVSAPDESDLKELLDNIRPDEELQEGLENTPPELSVTLLKHQRMGLTWMKRMEASRSKGGILADDMGLGKTIQTLALMMSNKSTDEDCKTNVIIAPVSLLRQWGAEIESKTKSNIEINIGLYHGDHKKKLKTFQLMNKYDVILVSYTTLSVEWKKHFAEELADNADERGFMPNAKSGGKKYVSPFFAKEAKFYRIILDEAQQIKNKRSLTSKSVTYLKAIYRFCLTGTPMQNSIEELYPIIRFLKIQPYCVEEKFRADIIMPIKSKSDLYDEHDMQASMRKLRAVLSATLLRRTKDSLIDGEPILNLPAKHVASDYVPLENEELEYYRGIETGVQKVAKKMMAETIRGSGVLTLLLRLRQACLHSYLVQIGQEKARIKRDEEDWGKFNVSWERMLNNVSNIKETPKQQVLKLSENNESLIQSDEDTITCPVCLDAIDFETPLLIFGECGHIICKACCNRFFESSEVSDDDDRSNNRTGECLDCKKTIKEQNMMEYIIFQKVHVDKLSIPEVAKFCREHYQSKVKSNQAWIREFIIRDEGFEPSAKIQRCIEIIQDIFDRNPGEKIIVFSQFTTLFDLIRLVLANQKIPFLRYDGTMNVEQKNTVIKEFYRSDTNVLLLSLRSGNAGLTLTCANHVIIMDPFWNPYVEEQAMGRAHRIGQDREVHVHRVLIEGTVESRIMELQEEKKKLISNALNERELKSISQLDRRELGFLFGLNSLRENGNTN